jgi:hypothetical protein
VLVAACVARAGVEAHAAPAADTVHVTYAVTQDWGTGFQATLTVTNNASWTISTWSLGFDAPWAITDIWGAEVASHTGGAYALRHAAWDPADLAPGQTVNIGWIGAPGAPRAPTNPTLNGAPLALNGDSPAPPPPRPVPAPVWPARVFSPFVDATLWPLFDLGAYAAATGARFLTLGFVTAQDGTLPTGAFGGFPAYAVGSGFRAAEIDALRGAGGDVRISFGGAAGRELALVCPTVDALRAAYGATIAAYGLTHVDFDIEGDAVQDAASIARRSQAIRLLQDEATAEGRTLHVTLTLPALPTGLVPSGLAVVESALAHGVRIDGVNIMAMDYGPAAPDPAGRMGEYAMQAATSVHAQLAAMLAAHGLPRTPAQVWAMIGVTPMLGFNDIPGEVFGLSDAAQVRAFAEEKAVGLLSFWDANRDQPCPGPVPQPDNFCSGVGQAPREFTLIFGSHPSPRVAADINADGWVDGADLGALLGAWNQANAAADLDRDGTVNGADLGVLLAAWRPATG